MHNYRARQTENRANEESKLDARLKAIGHRACYGAQPMEGVRSSLIQFGLISLQGCYDFWRVYLY